MTRHTPLLLTNPSRAAGVSRLTARLTLACLAVLLLISLTALATPVALASHVAPGVGGEPQTDLDLYRAIVDGVRHQGGYYQIAADALRAGGYPLRPFFAFRLPTLAIVQAVLPPVIVTTFLWILGAAVLAAWYRRLAPAMARPPMRLAVLLLLAGGCVVFWQAGLAPLHEVWAGLFIALSLALYRPDRWLEAVAFALAAAVIRETAALYLLVMGGLALFEGRRREALGWAAALALFALVLGAHAWAVSMVTRPLDPVSQGWSGLLGPGFFVRAVVTSTALSLLPLVVAAPLFALSLAGWAGWRDPLGLRVVAVLAAYGVLVAVFARPDTFYWALTVAPLALAGLAFAPDLLRDLVAAASDTRRITVRRVVR